jgi:hypothetical protein
MAFQSTTDFNLTSIVISRADGSGSQEMKNLVHSFTYIENIKYPFVMGAVQVVDSGGLLNKLPIQGGEIVEVNIKTSLQPGGQTYKLRVWKIANRFVQNKDQSYTLGLISEELLNNEFARVEVPLADKPDKIIAKLLKEYLKTTKEFYSEPCAFESKLIASRKRIFDIISMLLPKSVPKLKGAKPKTSSKTQATPIKATEQKVAGSAGYFFWENKRGYNFYSVDTLCSEEKTDAYDGKPWGPYVEKIANQDDGADDRFTISSVNYTSEIDLVTSMRMGRYSTKMCFFNHSTGQYDEYVYNLKDAFDDMKHLGSQSEPSLIKLGNDKNLSDYPTRVMSMLLDHETWYNESGPASPYDKDGATDPSPYAERHLEFAAQSIARYESLTHQTATIVIPGNSQICAGDKIEIQLLNKLPDADLKSEPYDPENSGVYLIVEVSHLFEMTKGNNGRFSTTLRLARDTHGEKGKKSEHGTK